MISMNEFDTSRTPWDDQLDSALAKYSAVEPRPGIEDRILANLKSQQTTASGVAWWRWAGALAAALLLTILVLWRVEKHDPQRIVRHPAGSQEQIPAHVVSNGTLGTQARPVAQMMVNRGRKRTSTRPEFAAAGPKLDQFPSPQPLSQEELALVRYVRSFPREATMVAQTQEEFDLETQREMNAGGSQNRPSGYIQQER